MLIFILGLLIFFGVHMVRVVAPDFRDAWLADMGEAGWKGLYALVALIGFALIVWGWILYRLDAPEIFTPPDWGRHVTYLFVLLAFILMIAAYLPAGRIKTGVRHPFLLAVMLWALGHLAANGDLASLLLFGAFLLYAVIDRISVAMRQESGLVFTSSRSDLIAIVGGVLAYAVFLLWLHGWLFGVSPAI